MYRGDRGLELVGAQPAGTGQGRGDQRDALGDQAGVPPRPVLFGERDQSAVGPGTCGTPCVREQHERQQPRHLPVRGPHLMDRAGEPDRLTGQLGPLQVGAGARGVALVKDQVEHLEHHAQPVRPLVRRRQAEREVGWSGAAAAGPLVAGGGSRRGGLEREPGSGRAVWTGATSISPNLPPSSDASG